jgi:hypothetical protein
MLEFSTFVVIGINFFLWYNALLMMGFSEDDIRDKIKYNFARVAWYILHKFSIIQLRSQKYIINPVYNYLYKPIQYILTSKYHGMYRIVLVKDGRELMKLKRKDDLINKNYDFDFILYHNDSFNTLILDSVNDIPDLIHIDSNILKTNVSFLCCQMTAEFESTKVTKLFELSDFLLNNNKILTRDFVKWYCKKHFHNEEWVHLYDFDNYSINLIDNEVNEINIDSTQFIVLRENTYNVYKNEKYEVKKDESDNEESEHDNEEESEVENEQVDNDKVEDVKEVTLTQNVGAMEQSELKERWCSLTEICKLANEIKNEESVQNEESFTTKYQNDNIELPYTDLRKYTNDSSSSLEIEECSDGDKNVIKIYC